MKKMIELTLEDVLQKQDIILYPDGHRETISNHWLRTVAFELSKWENRGNRYFRPVSNLVSVEKT